MVGVLVDGAVRAWVLGSTFLALGILINQLGTTVHQMLPEGLSVWRGVRQLLDKIGDNPAGHFFYSKKAFAPLVPAVWVLGLRLVYLGYIGLGFMGCSNL